MKRTSDWNAFKIKLQDLKWKIWTSKSLYASNWFERIYGCNGSTTCPKPRINIATTTAKKTHKIACFVANSLKLCSFIFLFILEILIYFNWVGRRERRILDVHVRACLCQLQNHSEYLIQKQPRTDLWFIFVMLTRRTHSIHSYVYAWQNGVKILQSDCDLTMTMMTKRRDNTNKAAASLCLN